MPTTFYRPLDAGQKQHPNGLLCPTNGLKRAAARKIIIGILITLLLMAYFVWCTLAVADDESLMAVTSEHSSTETYASPQTNVKKQENQYQYSSFIENESATKQLKHSRLTAAATSTMLSSFATTTAKSFSIQFNATNIPINITVPNTSSPIMQNYLPNKASKKTTLCSEQFNDTRVYMQNRPRQDYEHLPIVYFVTPTYPRREQIAELTRLAYTLLHVPRLHWILANDRPTCDTYLDYTFNKFGIPYTHLSSPMPDIFRKKKTIPRGVANRRAAIQWLRQNNITNGVLYFGDDDNTYDLKLFSEIRDTKRVSMFPVGLIERFSVSGPVVRQGKVVGFLDSWVADRHWPVDMAGFAVNLSYMSEHPNATMPYKAGYEEDYFLRSLALRLDYIEPKGNNGTEILVWHTQTKNKNLTTVRINHEYLDDRSNLGALFRSLDLMGVSKTSDTVGEKAIISKNGKSKPLSYFL